MKKTDQAGFGIVKSLLILVVVCILGFMGWYVFHTKLMSNKRYTTTTISKNPMPNSAPVDPYAGWKTYTSELGGISIKYPGDWTAPVQPYTSTLDDGSREEMMSWQSPSVEFDGQRRAISMTLQALTGYQRCDANLPIYRTKNITVDGHPLTIVTTGTASEIGYVYLTDASGLNGGGTLPTCSSAADIKSPLPQTKTLQMTVQFVAPCSPGDHCAYVNTPLTARQYSEYPLVAQFEQSFESISFH